MPSESKAQRELMAIAEHHPSEVSEKNKGVLKMSHAQLHDFASTKESKLPEHVKKEDPPKRDSKHHTIKHSHIVHHGDGTHTITYHHHDGTEHSHAVPDLEGLKSHMEDQMGAPNEGEDNSIDIPGVIDKTPSGQEQEQIRKSMPVTEMA